MTDTRQALEEAFATIHNLTVKPSDWDALGWNKADRFRRFLDAEAWTDAAMCLVPDDSEWPDGRAEFDIGTRDSGGWFCDFTCYATDKELTCVPGPLYVTAETPAHALLAACLKAKEQADDSRPLAS